MNTRDLLLEYVRFDPAKLKARLETEANYLTGNDTRELTLLKARLIHWTKPGDERFPKWLQQFDPSPNNKYVNWMITRYLQGGIKRLEDFGSGIVQALERFEELKNKKKLGADADINKLKSLADLNKLIQSHEETSLDYDAKEVDVILNSPKYSILSPKTYNASQALACGTDWCTAFPDMYRHYSKQGPLYIIKDKKTDEVWQFHFESDQFMDKNDEPLNQHDSIVTDDHQIAALIHFFNKHKEVGKAFEKLGKFKMEGDSWIFGSDVTTGVLAPGGRRESTTSTLNSYDKDGLRHRDPSKGPARIRAKTDTAKIAAGLKPGPGERTEEYFVHGERHREDGPAYVYTEGNVISIEKWYNKDILTRDPEDGPAVTTYLDTETGEIDPDSFDIRVPDQARERYERRYDYYVNGENIATTKDEGKAIPESAEDAQYEAELAEMLSIAGINPQQLAARNTIENKHRSAEQKSRFQAENKVQPGTDEWFRLWFARPDLTGENPFG